MRLKTLGVLVTLALSVFTVFYWITDDARRTARAETQEEQLLEFGEEIFADDPSNPAAAGCARCHGADGTGGEAETAQGTVQAPNLHSARIADKLQANPNYVNLVIRFGGVVVSGNVNSAMPAWSYEVGGPLNEQQIEALTVLVESWAEEAEEEEPQEVPNTVEAGAQVYTSVSPSCASCHGADLAGAPPQFPNIQGIGEELITELPVPPSELDQMEADYEEDPRLFLENWIRDSSGNYNGGESTGMPSYPEDVLSESQLEALITFLLEGEHGG
ncbi:MAG TPA: cytochrome c [Candidatus Limnocylindria bacterium]|nr:cytochrome c [Candidatus Limnocylindria bacterium]